MKYYLILILLFALIIQGCNPTINNPETDYRKGFEGVVPIMPIGDKSSIYENDVRPYTIQLHNRGASNIDADNPLTITLSYDNFYLEHTEFKDTLKVSDLLLGKSMNYPFGDSAEYSLGAFRAKGLSGQVESPETELFVNICYPYTTTVVQSICVNSDLYRTQDRRVVCEPQAYNFNEGQGGPIAVTKIEPDILLVGAENGEQRVRPLFKITIENKGNGIPYFSDKPNIAEFCQLNNVDKKNPNKVILRAWLNPGESDRTKGVLNCKPLDQGVTVVPLNKGKATVYCSLDSGSSIIADYNYLAVLLIEIDYIYSEGLTHNIEIFKKTFE